MKDQRLYGLLKCLVTEKIKSFEKLAAEIWISQPTLRDFMVWKYTPKTLKLIEGRITHESWLLWDYYVLFHKIEDNDE